MQRRKHEGERAVVSCASDSVSLLMRHGLGTDAPDRNTLAIQQHQEGGDEHALFREQDYGVCVVSRQDEEAG